MKKNYRFVHNQLHDDIHKTQFIFSGHIHPGIRLKGKGRQSLRLSCFYQKKQQFILPAFGELTGLHVLPEKEAEHIYPIAENKIFRLSHV